MPQSKGLIDTSSVLIGSRQSSFINTVCKFLIDVENMNDTVLVPSLLTDLDVTLSSPSSSSTQSGDLPECFDIQTLHQLLNRLKDELTITRFDNNVDVKSCKSCNFTSANNNSNETNQINVTPTTTPMMMTTTTTGTTTTTNTTSSARLAEGDFVGLIAKLNSSCKCSDSDDGFSSLNSYTRNCDDESTGSSPSSDSDSESCSSSSSPSASNQSRETTNESSPEYIVHLLRLHIQGIQSILNRFSKKADQVTELYIKSLN